MRDSAYWMRRVAETAVAYSAAREHPEKPGTLMAAQEDYDEAFQQYTNPFGIDKYQR